MRLIGLCLAAAFAIAALTASSAVAKPEWGKCEKVGSGGKYGDVNCSEKVAKHAGAYEYLKAPAVEAKREGEGKEGSVPFSGASVGNGGVLSGGLRECQFEGEPEYRRVTRQACAEEGVYEENYEELSLRIECQAETNTGETDGKKRVKNVHVSFYECELLGFLPCGNVTETQVDTEELKGFLGYIEKKDPEGNPNVGLVLEPADKHGLFADFTCGEFAGSSVGVGDKKTGAYYEDKPGVEKHGGYDQIISPITPVNEEVGEGLEHEAFKQVYTIEEGYPFGNLPRKLEGKHISQLENYLTVLEGCSEAGCNESQWSPAGEEITNENTPEEDGMIKA